MLLKLIPARQEPTIHFSLSFAELPDTLPTPASWTVQMTHLLREDLEVPATLHSLDRAAGIPSLLEEVALDLELREVRCRYIDGAIERFAFDLNGEVQAGKFSDALEGIIRVVNESTREDEKAAVENKRLREKQRSRSVSIATVVPAAAPVPARPSGKLGKHKKQRSLFMQFVSSIGSMVSLTSPSSSSFPHRAAKMPTSPMHTTVAPDIASATANAEPSANAVCHIPPTPGASARARALRRAARSALVDTFRRFVLGELAARFYVGPHFRVAMGLPEGQTLECPYLYRYQRERSGFCVWILHSMRRRALERMEQILEEAGAPPRMISFAADNREIDNMLQTTTMDVPLSFSDDEDEGDKSLPSSAIPEEVKEPRSSGRPSLAPRRTSSGHSTDSTSSYSSSTCSSSSGDSASTAATSVESFHSRKDLPDLPSSDEEEYGHRRASLLSIKEQEQPPLHHLSIAAQHEYTQLQDLRVRLNGLVQFAASQARVIVEESKNRADALFVRSRRRAWLNKALKHPQVVGAGSDNGHRTKVALTSPYALAAPFRSSPLAMYVFSADDLARQRSAISRGSVSSTSTLSSAYFRSVSSMSSTTSSSSASSVSSKSSSSKRTSVRPRIRPKLDFEAALAAAVIELDAPADPDIVDVPSIFDSESGQGDCEFEFEIYDAAARPAGSARRAVRSKRRAEVPHPAVASTQVFPVTESPPPSSSSTTTAPTPSLHAVRGRNHRRACEIDEGHRTFMGCDEIRVEDSYTSSSSPEAAIADQQHLELGFGPYAVHMFPLPPPHPPHLPHHPPQSLAFLDPVDPVEPIETEAVGPLSPTDVGTAHMASETELGLHKPIGAGRPAKIRHRPSPRTRTNSMIGALLGLRGKEKEREKEREKNVSALPLPLSQNSLLCRPLATATATATPQPEPAQAQAQAPEAAVSPSFGYISYEHNPPSRSASTSTSTSTSTTPTSPVPAPVSSPQPKYAPNRRAEDISRPLPSATSSPTSTSSSSSPALASAVYTNPEAGVDVEVNIQIHVPDTNSGTADPSKTGADVSVHKHAAGVPAVPRKRSLSYLGKYRPSHPRPKLNGVFAAVAEGEVKC